MMQINVPPDLQALVERRLSSGEYATPEDVVRRALEVLDAEESWTPDERHALDEKIARALQQVATGNVYGPDDARRKIAAMRKTYLAGR